MEARDVVLKARMLHADVFERERLLMESAGRIAKANMKELSENDQPTLSLSGLAVPTAIAVPMVKGGFYYVRTDKATWAQLVAGEQARTGHDLRSRHRAAPVGRPLGSFGRTLRIGMASR